MLVIYIYKIFSSTRGGECTCNVEKCSYWLYLQNIQCQHMSLFHYSICSLQLKHDLCCYDSFQTQSSCLGTVEVLVKYLKNQHLFDIEKVNVDTRQDIFTLIFSQNHSISKTWPKCFNSIKRDVSSGLHWWSPVYIYGGDGGIQSMYSGG